MPFIPLFGRPTAHERNLNKANVGLLKKLAFSAAQLVSHATFLNEPCVLLKSQELS